MVRTKARTGRTDAGVQHETTDSWGRPAPAGRSVPDWRTGLLFAATALWLVLSLPPLALAGGGGGAKPAKAGKDNPGLLEETVAMPLLVVPVTRNGRLWGQAFVSIELVAPEEIWQVRSQVHALQDTMVRTVHANPLDLAVGDPPRVGDAAFEAVEPLLPVLEQSMNQTLGAKLIDRLIIPKVFLRPL